MVFEDKYPAKNPEYQKLYDKWRSGEDMPKEEIMELGRHVKQEAIDYVKNNPIVLTLKQ